VLYEDTVTVSGLCCVPESLLQLQGPFILSWTFLFAETRTSCIKLISINSPMSASFKHKFRKGIMLLLNVRLNLFSQFRSLHKRLIYEKNF